MTRSPLGTSEASGQAISAKLVCHASRTRAISLIFLESPNTHICELSELRFAAVFAVGDRDSSRGAELAAQRFHYSAPYRP